ncbi:MAG: EAL domain-containing protein [Ilumatobacter sp.]|nr:EAL domain-containing protein [Ilumatobacter sp.]
MSTASGLTVADTFGPPDGAPRPFARQIARVRPQTRVVIYAAFLVVVGGGLLLGTPLATVTPERTWSLPFLALVAAFGIAEATALHVEIRKESHSLSLSGIPLMFGLLYVSPVALGLAYVLGTVPTLLWIRKSGPIKVLWNAALFFCEASLAAFIVHHFLGTDMPATATEWLVPLCAVLAAELLSLFAVPLVIMAVDVKFRLLLFRDVGKSQALALLAGTFTVTALAASVSSPNIALFALVPLVGVGVLLKTSGNIARHYKDLQQLHIFTRALTDERGSSALDVGLAELVQIMRTRSAGLLVLGDDNRPMTLRLLADDEFSQPDPQLIASLMADLLDGDMVTEISVADARPEARMLLRHLDCSKIVAVRVLAEVDHIGVLFVGDRLGMRRDFNADEHRLFGSLANTLSARLANDHLLDRLETQARSDALTGLPNRLSFEMTLAESITQPGATGAVVMVDLDRFKEVNDSLGHETGDRLLCEVADRLRSMARPTDVVARFGGDEFAILLRNIDSDSPGDLTQRVAALHRLITSKVELEGLTFEVGASLGVVQWPQQASDCGVLLHRADTAMYEAKRNQLGVVWYAPELDADAPRRLELYMSVSAALEAEEFCVHFQPKVSLGDGRITGAEALVRWTHPAHGPVSPMEFLPLIEQAGLISRLSRLVFKRAAEAARLFEEAGLDIPIAVNLTPRDLLDRTLVTDIADILDTAGVAPERMQVELTEDAMVVDFETCISALKRIGELGLQVAIDDFGTGYSSLQHLHRLPVDHLKIDRSFVSRLTTDDSAFAIVRASINLAADLELTTIAEGIEDVQTLRALARLGCREMQGYLVSRPQPIHEFMRWAHEWEPEWLVLRLIEDTFAVDDAPAGITNLGN